ncbi:MAG: MFS transporter [Pseudoprimorskyibacter sp.]|jgi:sugar phosphate permease|nr:MFS transporter [Pseudoprimorskyibacter sp.]
MLRFFKENARWLTAGFILAFGSSFGQTWFISLFAGEIRAAHGLSDGDWGWIYMIATLSSAGLLLMRGGLADTIPLRRLVVGVTALFAIACLIMAAAQNVWFLGLAVFMLRFCGQGMFTHISVTAMGRWFVKTRGRAVALASLGYQVGEAFLPLPVIAFVTWFGWRWGFAGVGIILAIGFLPLLFWLLSKERDPVGDSADVSALSGLAGRHWTRGDVLRHWLFWALLPLALTPGWIGTVVFFHQVHVAEVKGWSLVALAAAYPLYAVVAVTSSLVSGLVCDRFGPQRLLPYLLLPMGVSMLLIGPSGSPIMWGLVLSVMGISQGLINTFWGAFLPVVYGTRHLGSVRALMTALMVISSAVGPWVTGDLIDRGFDFPAQGVGHGVWCILLSVSLVLVARRLRRTI